MGSACWSRRVTRSVPAPWEQLRTHMRHLNALHPPEKHNGIAAVDLYEKGYGKDAAGIAMEAINHGKMILEIPY